VSTQRITKQSATRQQVLDLIERLGVGTAIPSERQLSADLGVSRLTLRAALDDLAREGYVVRRRGSGTYVQQPKIAQELTMTSFTRTCAGAMTPGPRRLDGDRTGGRPARPPAPVAFRGTRGEGSAGRGVDGDRDAAPAAPAHAWSRGEGSERSFYDLYRDRYGITIERHAGDRAHVPTRRSRRRSPPIRPPSFERTSRTRRADGRVVQSVYRGDRYRSVESAWQS
jgi:GntR family transcriptional regulator